MLVQCEAAEHRLAGLCAAQCLPLLGHMHPPFFKIMDEIQDGLRYLFQTDSKYVCLMSGTGHAGAQPGPHALCCFPVRSRQLKLLEHSSVTGRS